jgi:glycosyltransferase involved in cell wall biosynthesis
MTAVSVCMATYNGAAYISRQIGTILDELQHDDELIIVDDCSGDDTVDRAKAWQDARIRIIRNARNAGPNQSFARAIGLSTRPLIMLSDQDDVWVTGRRKLLADALVQSGKLLVSSNQEYMDRDEKPIAYNLPRILSRDSEAIWKNILSMYTGHCAYYGCAMAFRRQLIRVILPLPAYVESHDLWIAMAANILGANLHLDEVTLRRRIHAANASLKPRPVHEKIWSRVVHTVSLAQLLPRCLRYALSGASRRP